MREQTEARRLAYERQRRYPRPTEMGDGLCRCGCGQRTPIAKRTVARTGAFAGYPTRYLVGHQARGMTRGPGRYLTVKGYVLVRQPDHPQAVGGYVLEHRLVMERALGRPLATDESVHHLNHVRSDNRPVNLAVLSWHDHGKEHGRPSSPRRECSIEGCNRVHYGRGWCEMHYSRWRATGSTEPGKRPVGRPPLHRYCSVEDCGRKHLAKGLCGRHYAIAHKAQVAKLSR